LGSSVKVDIIKQFLEEISKEMELQNEGSGEIIYDAVIQYIKEINDKLKENQDGTQREASV
jgi:hypothetical protein